MKHAQQSHLQTAIVLFAACLLVNACSSTADQPNISYSVDQGLLYQSRLDENHKNYVQCAMFGGYVIAQGADLTEETIQNDCDALGNEYYLSVYYSSFGGPRNTGFNRRFRHNTAGIAKRDTFQRAFEQGTQI